MSKQDRSDQFAGKRASIIESVEILATLAFHYVKWKALAGFLTKDVR